MTSERWQQVEQTFHAALEEPAEGRDAWLRVACGTDVDLLKEVRSLLAADIDKEFSFEKELRMTTAKLLLAMGILRTVSGCA